MRHFFATAGPDPMTNGHAPVFHRDPWMCHVGAVETLTSAGITPPQAWSELLARYRDYIDLGDNAADRLTAEILAPSGGDMTALRANALAEQIARNGDDVAINERIRAAVLTQLEASYERVALRNYRAVATSYDEAAKAFTHAATTVDVEATGDSLVKATPEQRQSWLDAPALAGQLDAAMPVLFAAASLAGAPADVAVVSGGSDVATLEYQIAIGCDPGKAHRRKVWSAWMATAGRTGRWAKLVALNVKLRAAPNPASTAVYQQPTALVPVYDPGGAITHWDPHSGPLATVMPGHQPVNVGWLEERPTTDATP